MGAATRLVGLLTILIGIGILIFLPFIGVIIGGILIMVGFILLAPELVAAIIILGIIGIIVLFFFFAM